MKSLKTICTAAILALALSAPAYAGDMTTPGYTAPPPPPPPSSSNTSVATAANLSDTSTTGLAELLWVLASFF
jgi:hypothetical protein